MAMLFALFLSRQIYPTLFLITNLSTLMAGILYKWFLIASMQLFSVGILHHPVYVSVSEIDYNAKEKQLEISCKLFTDDFEKALRAAYNTHVDLLDKNYKSAMDKLVNDYIQKHFRIAVNGKAAPLKYIGFEQIEEGIYCYFEGDNITSVKSIGVTNTILYEYKEQQMGLIHCNVNGETKNYKLNNPEATVLFNF